MIGIDVGGANLKVADESGVFIYYCPLFEGASLAQFLEHHRSAGSRAAVVMSGELADCFASKTEGIAWIVSQVKVVFPQAIFYGTDGVFHDKPCAALAAANWLAAADATKEKYPAAVLVDMGSTTTDIVPLGAFPDILGMTDLQRLQAGYLIYSGLLRTPVPAHLPVVDMDGFATPTCPEFFATAADAHLVLGHIDPSQYTCDAADRGERTVQAALQRLSRVICADVNEIGENCARSIASAFWAAQAEVVRSAVDKVARKNHADNIVTAGIGSTLLARSFGWTDLRVEMGEYVDALPAVAVREVALRCNAG